MTEDYTSRQTNTTLLNPDQEILDAIDDSLTLFQMINQDAISKFIEYQKTSTYHGSMGNYAKMRIMDEIEAHKNKPWEHIIKTYNIMKHDIRRIDIEIYENIPDDYLHEFSLIIKKGYIGQQKVHTWIENNSKTQLEALYHACNVKIGSGEKYKDLDVLEIADITTTNKENVAIYNNVLEIKSPDDLIQSLKHTDKPIQNGIILTLHRDEKRYYKGTFYIFFAFNNKLYSISNQSKRLNLNNTEGDRNPEGYIQRKYENTWLPVYLLYGDKYVPDITETSEIPETRDITIINKNSDNIITTWDDIYKRIPECYHWINMVMWRVTEYVQSQKINKGITPNDTIKLIQTTNENSTPCSELKDNIGPGKYLYDIYLPKTQAITINQNTIPPIISTQQHIEDIITYKRRQNLASDIKSKLMEDYNNNHRSVYDKIRNIIDSKDIEWTILRALEDKRYTYIKYRDFGFDTHGQKTNEPYTIRDKKVMSIIENPLNGINNDDPVHVIASNNNQERYVSLSDTKCVACNKSKHKLTIALDFIDWKQMINFFDIPIERFPKEMIDHLHQQNEMYIGNKILNDLDPIDLINDPWFRTDIRNYPKITVFIPICKRCYNKYKKQIDKKYDHIEK
jgi:hypothetical protein